MMYKFSENREFGVVCAALILTIFLATPTLALAPALAPIGKLVAGYLFGKVVDQAWDKATGKPNIRDLDHHLKELEAKLEGFDQPIVEIIRKLRSDIDSSMTKTQYLDMAAEVTKKINERLEYLERKIEENSHDIEQNSNDISLLKERIEGLEARTGQTIEIDRSSEIYGYKEDVFAAIKRANLSEIRAAREMNPALLVNDLAGDAYNTIRSNLQKMAQQNLFAVLNLHSQDLISFEIDADRKRAQVTSIENWSADFYSIVTGKCVKHIPKHKNPQVYILERVTDTWTVSAVIHDFRIPTPSGELCLY